MNERPENIELANKRLSTLRVSFVCIILATIILVFDLFMPLGIAAAVPYVAVVLISSQFSNKKFILYTAFICSILTFIGFYFSPVGGELWKVLVNRSLALFVIWITAILTLQWKLSKEKNIMLKDIAEESNKAKSEFLAIMSHEIRTPMNAIIGMSHLAIKSGLTGKQYNYVGKINSAAQSLLGIINGILDFSKIEAGEMELDNIEFNLEDVLNAVTNLIGIKAHEKGLEFVFNINPETPLYLVGDPLRLRQILINLVNNAIKFTNEGTIEVSVKPMAEQDKSVQLEFSVRDTGIGIKPELQSRLFKAFSQVDSSTTREYGGSGLGLIICKQLTKLLQGEIRVDSKPGVGSTFTFTALFGVQTSISIQQNKTSVAELKGLPVLVVDDDEFSRNALRVMLEHLGCKVLIASSGDEAISVLKTIDKGDRQVRLVFIDWNMPGMNGVETMRFIRTHEKLTGLTITIMVTSYAHDEVLDIIKDSEVEFFLFKPITPSALLDSIMEVIGHKIAKQARAVNNVERALRLSGVRILLVEDNKINQELATEYLKIAGILVEVADNGQEALAALEVGEFDGVLMDIQMPVMDGYEATRAIRAQKRFQQLPVIAISANAMPSDVEKSINAGMNDHISKPFDEENLFSTLTKWVVPKNPQVMIEKSEMEPAYANLTESLIDIDCIDIKAGLAVALGDEKSYKKILRMFLESQADFVAQFETAMKNCDKEACTRITHTLKSVAANIGAKGVETTAKALEDACKKGWSDKKIAQLLANVEQRLSQVIAALQELLRKKQDSGIMK